MRNRAAGFFCVIGRVIHSTLSTILLRLVPFILLVLCLTDKCLESVPFIFLITI